MTSPGNSPQESNVSNYIRHWLFLAVPQLNLRRWFGLTDREFVDDPRFR